MKKHSDYFPIKTAGIKAFVSARNYVNDKLHNIHELAEQTGLKCVGKGQLTSSIHGADRVHEVDGQLITRWIDIAAGSGKAHRIGVVLSATPEWDIVVRLESDVTNATKEVWSATNENDLDAAVLKIQNAFTGILEGIKNGWLK